MNAKTGEGLAHLATLPPRHETVLYELVLRGILKEREVAAFLLPPLVGPQDLQADSPLTFGGSTSPLDVDYEDEYRRARELLLDCFKYVAPWHIPRELRRLNCSDCSVLVLRGPREGGGNSTEQEMSGAAAVLPHRIANNDEGGEKAILEVVLLGFRPSTVAKVGRRSCYASFTTSVGRIISIRCSSSRGA